MNTCSCPSWIRIAGKQLPDTPANIELAYQAARAGLKVEMYGEEGPMFYDYRPGSPGLICGTCNPEETP
jgi:hypothetical protein